MSRLSEFNRISTSLVALGDEVLYPLSQQARYLSSRTALLTLEGHPVFIKRIALTEREWRLVSTKPTNNLFNLPVCLHYGVGSRGFGAWREWRCHQLATEWVLSGQCEQFPLLYDWRIFPRLSDNFLFDDSVRDAEWEAWGKDPCYGVRLDELQRAPAELVLFLEYIPARLSDYKEHLSTLFEKLMPVCDFMEQQGFIHFDAHFENILTDGHDVFFSDFGLSLSTSFDLAQDEHDFFIKHKPFDRYFIILNMLHALSNPRFLSERAWVNLQDKIPDQQRVKSPQWQRWIEAYWPLGICLDEFYQQMYRGRIHTLYPGDRLAQLYERAGQVGK